MGQPSQPSRDNRTGCSSFVRRSRHAVCRAADAAGIGFERHEEDGEVMFGVAKTTTA